MNNLENIIIKKQIEEYAFNKQVTIEEAFNIFELALQNAIELKYKIAEPLISIDKDNGKISLYKQKKIVKIKRFFNQISIDDVRKIAVSNNFNYKIFKSFESNKFYDQDPKINDFFIEEIELPKLDKGILLSLSSLLKKWSKIIKNKKQYEMYKEKIGCIITCRANEIDKNNNAIIELEEGKGLLRRVDMIPGEEPSKVLSENNIKAINSKSFKAVIHEVIRDDVKLQVFLSRTSNKFLEELMKNEIEEVASKKIHIKKIARFPGIRSKVLVSTKEYLDPVGACIGVGGIRIKAISQECNNENIDVINWDDDKEKLIKNIFSSINIKNIIIDETYVELIVHQESDYKQAIGKGGYNIRLASKLLDTHFKVFTYDEYQSKQSDYIHDKALKLEEALEIDEYFSKFLVLEGFSSVFDIYKSNIEDLMTIDGCDEDLANALQSRSKLYLDEIKSAMSISDCLWNSDFISLELIVELAKSDLKIKKLDDLAGLSKDEFIEAIKDIKITESEVDDIILTARKKINWISE